jgi:hypothetical protein
MAGSTEPVSFFPKAIKKSSHHKKMAALKKVSIAALITEYSVGLVQ